MRDIHTTVLAAAMTVLPALAAADTDDGDSLIGADWDTIVAQARGGEVNFFLWGGSDDINRYVTEYVGGILADDYDITLNRVGLNDTAEAVNIVLGEAEAGIDDAGSVDMIWINGENFRTMKQADLAWCGYVDTLPNGALIDWDNPSIANDFGLPVDGCEVPWSTAQFAFATNTALVEDPPRSIAELIDWVADNPGQFTYPAPPDFNGAVFVRHVFYHAAGGPDRLLGDFDQATFDAVAAETWDILNAMEPDLWREGATYPQSLSAMEQLFANQEVALTFNYEPASVGVNIENGTFPPTARGYALTDGTIANTNYTVIPYNSANKAAALVLQNVLLSVEAQIEKADPAVWGARPGIDFGRADAAAQAAFAAVGRHPDVVPVAELSANALPELQADWIAAIEQGWLDNVGN